MAGYRWITDKHVKSDSLVAVIQAYEWETRQVGSDTSGASRKLIVTGRNACNERKPGVELLKKIKLWQQLYSVLAVRVVTGFLLLGNESDLLIS